LKIVSNWTHKIWSFIVLLDSRSFKDSNEISFVIFRPTDQKIWISKDWVHIWLLNSILNSVWFGDRHVADPDRVIQIRLDRQRGASDFKRIGRPRSSDTSSLKWFDLNHEIQIGRSRTEERGAHRIRLGFRPSSPARRIEGGRRWRYSDSWTTASSQQDAGGRGGLGCMVFFLDCFQTRRREATTAELLITANILVTGKNMHVTNNKYQWQTALRPSLIKVGRQPHNILVTAEYYSPITSNSSKY
jgi:hypothetical protein